MENSVGEELGRKSNQSGLSSRPSIWSISFWLLSAATLGVLTYFGVTYRYLHSAIQPLTALTFHIAILSGVIFLTKLSFRVGGVQKESATNISLAVASVCTILTLTEIGLRISGKFLTQTEHQAFGQYDSVRKREHLDSWFWTHRPNDTITVVRPEFRFHRVTNSLGLSEVEFSKVKQRFRVVSIGDSFTEGYGVETDSTWVKNAERKLKSNDSIGEFEILNAGIGGSDFVFGYVLLDSLLIDYHPDLVVLSINSSDFSDVCFRGGFERFKPDGSVGEPAPNWEWLYMLSHTVRMVVHNLMNYSKDYLIPNEVFEVNRKRFDSVSLDALSKYILLSERHHFRLLVVFHPVISDFANSGYYPLEFAHFVDSVKKMDIEYLDVMECFNSIGINDQNSAGTYYWRTDTHFNHKGYQVYGECVADRLATLIN